MEACTLLHACVSVARQAEMLALVSCFPELLTCMGYPHWPTLRAQILSVVYGQELPSPDASIGYQVFGVA